MDLNEQKSSRHCILQKLVQERKLKLFYYSIVRHVKYLRPGVDLVTTKQTCVV